MRKKPPGQGKFVQLSDRPRVKKSLMIDADGMDYLESARDGNESLSDKVNQAIAFYIQNTSTVEND